MEFRLHWWLWGDTAGEKRFHFNTISKFFSNNLPLTNQNFMIKCFKIAPVRRFPIDSFGRVNSKIFNHLQEQLWTKCCGFDLYKNMAIFSFELILITILMQKLNKISIIHKNHLWIWFDTYFFKSYSQNYNKLLYLGLNCNAFYPSCSVQPYNFTRGYGLNL